MNQSLKRPRSPSPYFAHLSAGHTDHDDRLDTTEAPLIRSIEALEAQLCDIESLARQVESRGDETRDGRLIRLNEHHVSKQSLEDSSHEEVWVDRYDARLLLSPPPFNSVNSNLKPKIISPPPLSPTGFSDLPSDHEEMFYFKPNERLEIAQKKLRRRRDDERTIRIKMREEEDKQHEEELRISKIPPPEQINLMSRTLEALKSSPSPSLLEIRILANHGTDPRFSSFLGKDGKWSTYWELMKAEQSREVQISEPSPSKQLSNNGASSPDNGPSAGLVDYDDSSSENEKETDESDLKLEKTFCEDLSSNPCQVLKSSDSNEPSTSMDNLPDLSPSKVNLPNGKSNTSMGTVQNIESEKNLSEPNTLDSEIIFDPDSTPNTSKAATENHVNPAEILNRQQRAKLWAEKRRILSNSNSSAT